MKVNKRITRSCEHTYIHSKTVTNRTRDTTKKEKNGTNEQRRITNGGGPEVGIRPKWPGRTWTDDPSVYAKRSFPLIVHHKHKTNAPTSHRRNRCRRRPESTRGTACTARCKSTEAFAEEEVRWIERKTRHYKILSGMTEIHVLGWARFKIARM